MKKLISLSLAIVMIVTLFSAFGTVSASADSAPAQTVLNIDNTSAFGGYFHSTAAGYASDDSVCINGAVAGFGFSQKLTGLENGYYVFSCYLKNNGVDGVNKKIKLTTNTGTEKSYAVNSEISNWTKVYVMANVTDGYCFIGGWCSNNSNDASIQLDCIKFEKINMLTNTFGQTDSKGYFNDKCYYTSQTPAASGGFGQAATINELEPLTTYTVFFAVNGTCNGNVKIRTFNSFANTAEANCASTCDCGNVASAAEGQWKIYSFDITTGLNKMITITTWNKKLADASYTFRLSSIAYVKKSDNTVPFIDNKIIAGDTAKDIATIVDNEGFVTENAIKIDGGNVAKNFGKWFGKVDNGLYLFTAYAKSENASFTFKGHDGNWSKTEYGTPITASGNEWIPIQAEVQITGNELTIGFWFSTLANDLYLDGFKIQKLDAINIVNPNNWWSRTPTRYGTYCAKGYQITNGGYNEYITQYKVGENLIDLEANTTYVMCISYSAFVTKAENAESNLKADTYIQTYDEGKEGDDYASRISWTFENTENGKYKTATLKFTTGSEGKIRLGFWSGSSNYTIFMEGHAIFKADKNYYKRINEADIEEEGVYLTDDNSYGYISAVKEDALVLGDANGDGKTDLLDLVRIKKYCADNTTKIVLKACRFDEEKGQEITIEAIDLVSLVNILLGK